MGIYLSGVLSQSLNLTEIKNGFRSALGEAICQIESAAEAQQTSVKDYASTVLVLVCFFDVPQQQYVYLSLAVGDGEVRAARSTRAIRVLRASTAEAQEGSDLRRRQRR